MGRLNSLTDYLTAKRALVETHLDAVLGPRAGLPAPLLEAMRYAGLAPGKRLRPLLRGMAVEACGGEEANYLAGGLCRRIHPTPIRSSMTTCPPWTMMIFAAVCRPVTSNSAKRSAILAGDALQALAFQVLADGYASQTAAACCKELALAAGGCGMVGGQSGRPGLGKR